MMNSRGTNPSRPLTQLLLLVGFLVAGLAVMWHVTQNVIPRETSQPELAAALQPVAAPSPETYAPPADTASAGAAAGETAETASSDSSEGSGMAPEATAAPALEPASLPATSQWPDVLKNLESRSELPRLVSRPDGRFIETAAVIFNSGSSQMRKSSYPPLDRLADLLRQYPQIHLVISGHTDNLGSESVNKRVSAERAAAVMQYLVAQGVDSSRLQSQGLGSSSPIASNDTQLGRQTNRRIEFLVASPK